MKKFAFHKKTKRIKNPETEKSIAIWMYGYYACSSLCMIPTIDLSENKQDQL